MNQFGWVDVLVNNVGVSTAVPATQETPEQFRSVIDIDLSRADLIGLTRDLAQQRTGRKGIASTRQPVTSPASRCLSTATS